MPISWITIDGRRIPLNSGKSSFSNEREKLELPKFINTNALCPVCRQKVVYYQNSFGSRVFFNDLGWPWEKHECTSAFGKDGAERRGASISSHCITLTTGEQLEALGNGYLMGHYDEEDDEKSFALLRLKTPKGRVLFVECKYRRNQVHWDSLQQAAFFLRKRSSTAMDDFSRWFFCPSNEDSSLGIKKIEVSKTTIPFSECVGAFRSG